jgi:hypothetical protein
MKRFILFLTIFSLISFKSFAADVQVAPNQAKLEINGAVCAYCAYGMQKGLSKMGCVDQSQGHKGVESDIENQIITIHLKEGEKVDLKEMTEKIRKSGYEPRAFHMRVKGQSIVEGDRKFITNEGNEKLYELTGDLAKNLASNQGYDLQLLIEETSIKTLKDNQPPLAQVHTILEGE